MSRQQVDLPKKLSSQAEALLEQKTITPDTEQLIRQEVTDLVDVQQYSFRWAFLLSSLSPKLQPDLLNRLINGLKPAKAIGHDSSDE